MSATHDQRNKSLRIVDFCEMKLKIMKTYSQSDHSVLLFIEISLHADKKYPCYKYNHDQDFLDLIKINSFVMNIAGKAVA